MRVFGWSAGSDGCCWYRLRLPLDELAVQGHTTRIGTFLALRQVPDWDVIVAQRTCLPEPSALWQRIAKLPNRPRLVFEVDDDLFDLDPSNSAHALFGDPTVQANLKANIRAADLVTVSTEPLADVMRRHNPNVVVLPNCVPGWLLDHPSPARTDGIVTVGWQGSDTHAMDWPDVAGQVGRFFRRHLTAELHTIGAPCPTWPAVPLHRHTGWQPDLPAYYRTVDWHVALAPLRPHLFNRSKSPIRVLEAAALGIPAVASDVGPYSGWVEHGVTGFLARQPHEWPVYLRTLLDPQARAEMGAAARKVAAGWTVEARAGDWAKAYAA